MKLPHLSHSNVYYDLGHTLLFAAWIELSCSTNSLAPGFFNNAPVAFFLRKYCKKNFTDHFNFRTPRATPRLPVGTGNLVAATTTKRASAWRATCASLTTATTLSSSTTPTPQESSHISPRLSLRQPLSSQVRFVYILVVVGEVSPLLHCTPSSKPMRLHHSPVANVIKLFTAVSYDFS
jgi:hypothetical protein